MELNDLLGEAKLWPKKIRKLFLTKNLCHWERIVLTAFIEINGLNPVIYFEWLYLLGCLKDADARRHIQYLFRAFDEGKYACSLYGYNVAMNRYHYIDGSVRIYQNQAQRK